MKGNVGFKPGEAQAGVLWCPVQVDISLWTCGQSSPTSAFPLEILGKKSPAVLVFMTINTEVLPVGAVRRVVQMVSILVVNGQKMPVLIIEFSSTPATNEAVDLEGSLAVITVCGFGLINFLDQLIDGFLAAHFFDFRISPKVTILHRDHSSRRNNWVPSVIRVIFFRHSRGNRDPVFSMALDTRFLGYDTRSKLIITHALNFSRTTLSTMEMVLTF